ncbi:hypothetical protein STEG23_001432 [Scotinomys teguina]
MLHLDNQDQNFMPQNKHGYTLSKMEQSLRDDQELSCHGKDQDECAQQQKRNSRGVLIPQQALLQTGKQPSRVSTLKVDLGLEKSWELFALLPHVTKDTGAASHTDRKSTQEQPVTLGGRGPRSSQSPSEEELQPLPETQEQPATLGGKGPRNTQTLLEQETSPAPNQGRNGKTQCKSTYNNMKNETSPESSPPPTPRPEHYNVDKAEENDLKNSFMKMIEEALEGKMKNTVKEIEEKTNKKLEEMNKEIEDKNKNGRNR